MEDSIITIKAFWQLLKRTWPLRQDSVN